MGTRYIIIVMKYLKTWVEEHPMKDCTTETIAKFMFEFIISRFVCQNILISKKGSNFLNETIETLKKGFHIYHQKSMPYHP